MLIINSDGADKCLSALRTGKKVCPLTGELYAQQGENGPLGCDVHVINDQEGSVWAVLTGDGWLFLTPVWEDEIEAIRDMLNPIPVIFSEVWRESERESEERESEISKEEVSIFPTSGIADCEWHSVNLQLPLSNHRREHQILYVTYECHDEDTHEQCNDRKETIKIAQRWVATRKDCAGNPCRGRKWKPCVGLRPCQ